MLSKYTQLWLHQLLIAISLRTGKAGTPMDQSKVINLQYTLQLIIEKIIYKHFTLYFFVLFAFIFFILLHTNANVNEEFLNLS